MSPETTPLRVRFAPSPTGHLHLGNVRTALFNWLYARRRGGVFVLRIEDTDAERSTDESMASVLEDLRWLGLDWDEGPDAGGEYGPYRQTERYGTYREYVDRLLEEDKAYRCYCTQEELNKGREAARAAGKAYVYPGTCRALTGPQRQGLEAEGRRPAMRLRTTPHYVSFRDLVRGAVSIHTSAFGDFIIVRPDGSPTYNFAVVVDDSLMHITHVIRGEDHLSNTPKQVLVYEALGFDPPQFAHLSMILGPDGGKLSKRHGDVSLDAFRARGFLPGAMANGLALLGWSDPDGREVFGLDELKDRFDLERVNKAAAVFDEPKFRYLNREHLKALDDASLMEALKPYMQAAGRLPQGEISQAVETWAGDLARLMLDRIEVLSDAESASDPVFVFRPEAMDEACRQTLAEPEARRVIETFLEKGAEADLSVPGAFKDVTKAVKEATGVKGRGLFHPLRVAITGEESGPELALLVPLLEAGSRLDLPAPVTGPLERMRRSLQAVS
jgi:nondiscriminating glutamyl-tRNA synthetase